MRLMFNTSGIVRIIGLLCALLLLACGEDADDSNTLQDDTPNLGQEIVECQFTDTELEWNAATTSGDSFDAWAEGFTGTYSSAEVDDEPAILTLSKGTGVIVHRDSPQCGALYEIPLHLYVEQGEDSLNIVLNGSLDEGPDAELIATSYYDAPDALEPFVIIPALDANQQLSDIQVALTLSEDGVPTVQVHMRIETTEGSDLDGTVSLENVLLTEWMFGALD